MGSAIRRGLWALVLLSAALLVAPQPHPAQAEEGAEEPVWIYEVRVVRVDPVMAEGTEAPSPFPELQGTTVTLAYPEMLTRLKARGRTHVLMDQRISALPGIKSLASEESSEPVLVLNSEDLTNAQYRASVVRTGCHFEQTTDTRHLDYSLQVTGNLNPPQPKTPSPSYAVSWRGSHLPLNGRTLVLVHRRQIQRPGAAEALGVEHYAFITGRVGR
ncbi:MAG: hypothetical protein O2894_02505 [Planctomycetota bacterium]|nr:hypothetical protein [Planctomycetota bacterium]